MFNAITRIFNSSRSAQASEQTLSFDGLNPLLAKQLSELETQIGQLAQVQFELSQERQRMRIEMEALKKAVAEPREQPADSVNTSSSTHETNQ